MTMEFSLEINFDKFNPDDYLDEYYSTTDGENHFLLDFYARTYSKIKNELKNSNEESIHMAEAGGGPAIYQLISAVHAADQISFFEYNDANRKHVKNWLNGTDTFWDPFFEKTLELESKYFKNVSKSISERKNELKSKIITVEECDLFSSPPVRDSYIPEKGFMIVSSSFCAESITSSKDCFRYAIHSLFSLSAPSGFIVLTMLKNADKYRSGKNYFPATPIDEDDIKSILAEAGFHDIEISVCPADRPEQGYEGMMGICARRKFIPEHLPMLDALQNHKNSNVISFHVPGHKGGKWNRDLKKYFGDAASFDLNSMDGLDDLSKPVDVIREAQQLAAEAFSAGSSCFEINGATGGVHAMILSFLNPGETVIVQRNSHRSVFSALILGRLIPVYLPVRSNDEEGIIEPPSPEEVESTISKNPEAKAILLVNPDYYGQSGKLREIAAICRKNNKLLLVDESHGSHFYFHPFYPGGAIQQGAHVSVVSLHKTAGSLTQTALLLVANDAPPHIVEWINDIHLLLRSTSASYLLMLSLDLARQNLLRDGYAGIERALSLSNILSDELYRISNIRLIRSNAPFHDPTRAALHLQKTGLSGFTMESILRKEYNIQVEMSTFLHNILIITGGNSVQDIRSIASAISEISTNSFPSSAAAETISTEAGNRFPEMARIPSEAFHASYECVSLEKCDGRICSEFIMIYPPGIPLVVPGEIINTDTIESLQKMKQNNVSLQGLADPTCSTLRVILQDS